MTADTLDAQAASCARLGAHHHGCGNFERAAHWYRFARDLAPDNGAVLFNLAVTSVRAGRSDDALVALNALDANLPSDGGPDPMRFASRYNRLLAEHGVLELKRPTEAAREDARVLSLELLKSLAGLPGPQQPVALRHLEGAATSLLACLMPDDDDGALPAGMTREALIATLDNREHSGETLEAFAHVRHSDDATTRYNLACRRSARGHEDEAVNDLKVAARTPLLRHLIDKDARLVELRKKRPAEVEAIIRHVTSRERVPGRRLPALTFHSSQDEAWDAASGAFAGIASAVEDLMHGMAWLVTGSLPTERDPGGLVPSRYDAERAFSTQSLGVILPGRAGTSEWEEVMQPRLWMLLGYPVWRRMAAYALDVLKRRYQRRVTEWSTAMSRESDLARVLGRVEQLGERVAQLSAQIWDWSEKATLVLDGWATTLAEAISLRDDLIRAARPVSGDPPMFPTAVPGLYSDQLRTRAETAKRDRTGAREVLQTPLGTYTSADIDALSRRGRSDLN